MRDFLERIYYAIGPLGAGIILDVLDLATFGPIGILLGALIGGYAGWILAEFEGFDRNMRLTFAICAAIYMTIPFTEPLPAATIFVLLARLFAGPPANAERERSAVAAEEAEPASIDS